MLDQATKNRRVASLKRQLKDARGKLEVALKNKAHPQTIQSHTRKINDLDTELKRVENAPVRPTKKKGR